MFSDNTLPAAVVIGAFRLVAKKHTEGHSIDQALLLVANEILEGINKFEEGNRKPVTRAGLILGDFIGDKK